MKKMLLLLVFLTISFHWYSQEWVALNSMSDMNIIDVFFVNDQIGFVSGESGTILKTTDAGATWTNLNTGVSNSVNLASLYFLNENEGFAVGDASTIIHTIDGGVNWSDYNTNASANFRDIIFWNENDGIILGGSNGVYLLTSDGGTTWVVQNPSFPEPIRGANLINDDLYFIGLFGTIYRMDTTLMEFTDFATDAPFLFNVDGSGDLQIAVGQNGSVVKTNDAWQTSQIVPWNNSDWLAHVNYLANGDFIQVGGLVQENIGYIHTSTDNGVSWETYIWPEARLFSSCETPAGELFAVGVNGTILKRAADEVICETPVIAEVSITSCDNYYMDGENVLTESGLYEFYHTTADGCDSIVILNLSIVASPEVDIQQEIAGCGNSSEITISVGSGDQHTFQIASLGMLNTTGSFIVPFGSYIVEISNPFGCVTAQTVTSDAYISCPADFDGDSLVDVEDLMLFTAAYACTGDCCPYDINGDGNVSVIDLLAFISDFGMQCE